MTTANTTTVRTETHGRVPRAMAELAAAKVSSLIKTAPEPVLLARVTLTMAADPAVARPAVAQATVDMNGRIVRAQAAEQTMRAAIYQMQARLKVRLDRAARNWAALRGTVPTGTPGEWRHQSIPAYRPAYFPRPSDEREVVFRASYAAGPETPEQAAAELDLLDYDFHLFVERSTGQDGVIWRTASGYGLALADPKPGTLSQLPASIAVGELAAPWLAFPEAAERLDATSEPFIFFVDPRTGRGRLIYHRYDGHYGLIIPPDEHD
ncbi:MAG TPA: sigma 54 modulation/S30EA ribosomal C-terminal domain-containing protein [Streptosporangiaceae bacterium]